MTEKNSDIQKRLEATQKQPHCANCGKINPPIFNFYDGYEAGLTQCCHEAVCERLDQYNFGNLKVSVKACCWSVAEMKFKIKGVDVTQEKGMYRSQ